MHIHLLPCTDAGCHDVPDPSCGDGNCAVSSSIGMFIPAMEVSCAGDAAFPPCVCAGPAEPLSCADANTSDNAKAKSSQKANEVFLTKIHRYESSKQS